MYKSGDIVVGTVTNITHFGLFVETADHWKGLVHISEISENYVYNIEDYFAKNQEIKVFVLSVDDAKKQLSCSYKKAHDKQIETKQFDSDEEFAKLKESLEPAIKETLNEIENQNK